MIKGHGDDLYCHGSIRANFSSNVYSATDRGGLLAHLRDVLDGIGSYPEPEPYSLERDLSRLYGFDAACVSVTNGATEAIYLIAQAFAGSASAVLCPTFSEYADACHLHGHRVCSIMQPEDLPADARMLWLCNPNNPTGRAWDADMLLRMICEHREVLFVIDQSYAYFSTAEVLDTAAMVSQPNVILLHSLTKRFAIPGLRLGYLTATPSLVSKLRAHRMPWSVNALAIAAGSYLVQAGMPASVSLEALHAETERLRAAIASMDEYEVERTDTHFMLIRSRKRRATDLKQILAEQYGLLIRDASNFEGLDAHYFRIATQTPQENDWLIEALLELAHSEPTVQEFQS